MFYQAFTGNPWPFFKFPARFYLAEDRLWQGKSYNYAGTRAGYFEGWGDAEMRSIFPYVEHTSRRFAYYNRMCRQRRNQALFMATHPRLGAESWLHQLDAGVLKRVAELARDVDRI